MKGLSKPAICLESNMQLNITVNLNLISNFIVVKILAIFRKNVV